MDQVNIGRFIAENRKKQNLTQIELAEKLYRTDRAVSKWENGKSMPDSSIMLKLCEILKITVNDLLSGEIVSMDEYKEKLENNILQLVKEKEDNDKKLLSLEILIGIFCSLVACFLIKEEYIQIILVVTGFILGIIGIMFALRIEQTAGYYECGKCHHKYVPTFASVMFAPHINRTRFMKCPKCQKFSWNKKTIKK